MNKYRSTFLIVAHSVLTSVNISASIPEWVKTAAGVSYTTLSKSRPETKEELLNGSLPTSTQRMWGTATAALFATIVTNRLLESNATYRLLDQTTRRIARRYTTLPPWARSRIMPGLSIMTSSLFYTLLFQTFHEPACRIEKELISTENVEKKERPE